MHHNLALAIVLAEQRHRQCPCGSPCGAVADRPFGLCRKCQDRNGWRRKNTASRRKATRRQSGHRARKLARIFGMEK